MRRTYSAMARSSLPVRSSFSAFFRTSARSIGTDRDLDPIKQGWWPERAAMRLGIAMPGDGVEVIARRVSLMAVESIAGIVGVELEHRAVARDLGHDGRGCNRRAPGVAVNDAALGHREVGDPERLPAVDQDHVGQRRARQNGALHGPKACLMDIDAVDLVWSDRDHRPAGRLTRDALVQTLARERGHGLRIADAGNVAFGIEDDGGGDHGPRQTAASDFVNARH